MAKIYNNKKENKPAEVIEQVEKIIIREEKEIMAQGKTVKLQQRFYNPENKLWENSDLTGKISVAHVANLEIKKGIVEVDEFLANEILSLSTITETHIDKDRKPMKVVMEYFKKVN